MIVRVGLIAAAATLGLGCAVGDVGNPFLTATDSSSQNDDDDDDDDDNSDSTGSLTTNVTSASETASQEDTGTPTSGVVDTDSSTTSIDPTNGSSSDEGPGDSSSSGVAEESSSSTTGVGTYEYCPMNNTLSACATPGSNSEPYIGLLDCVQDDTLSTPDSWDFFVIDNVSDGDCVYVEADNVDDFGIGDGDITALVVDAEGNYYGLEPDWTELDDETTCTNEPHNGFDCPSAGVAVAADGPVVVGVAQWLPTTSGCTEPSPYTLWVAVNGSDVDLSGGPELDDLVVDPFTCP